jgi:hypothetical protein
MRQFELRIPWFLFARAQKYHHCRKNDEQNYRHRHDIVMIIDKDLKP